MNTTKTVIPEVADRINRLGGPTKVAELLGYDKATGGVQRVQNWLTRGIPAQVQLDNPEVFLRPIAGSAEAADAAGAPQVAAQ